MGSLRKRSKEAEEPKILLETKSHSCPITAIVEQDGRVAYFYLWGEHEQFGIKSCWIRNLEKAPEEKEEKSMQKGMAPMLPKKHCKYPEGQEKLDKDNLEIVWLEEGDGAALLENGEIIGIIPSWSGHDGFSGYARDCIGNSDFAWELEDKNEILKRVSQSIEFIKSWDIEENPFQILQPTILLHYEEILGQCNKYFAIDNDEWPPKGLYLHIGKDKTVFATVAVSLRPQPIVEMYSEQPNEVNRIELGLIINSDLQDDQIIKIASLISGQAALPWNMITFLGEGHTIDFEISKNKTSVVLTNKLKALPRIELPDYRGSRTNFLWMVPISSKEREHIIQNGSNIVLNNLNNIGAEIFNLNRKEVL